MADLIGVQQAQGTHGAGPDLHVGGNPTTITNLSCSVKNADERRKCRTNFDAVGVTEARE